MQVDASEEYSNLRLKVRNLQYLTSAFEKSILELSKILTVVNSSKAHDEHLFLFFFLA